MAASLLLLLSLGACGGGSGTTTAASSGTGNTDTSTESQQPDIAPGSLPAAEAATVTIGDTTTTYFPLFAASTPLLEQIQYTEPDGTLVTLAGFRPTGRHARERGEPWDSPVDVGSGNYFAFPTFYFQNRTFGLEIRDTIPAGGKQIQFFLHVNNGTFDGTTFSLFRNVLNPNVRDYGWSANTGFNNPKEGGKPICHALQPREDCMVTIDSNWRTDPHSPLQIGDVIELAPAPRLLRDDATGIATIDGGGSRYYSFEQLYIVGKGMRPWYGIAPNLDSAPLPDETLLGGQASVSYNYSEEPNRVFQQTVNNIGMRNIQRFVEGRRLFHTSFADGKHSENPDANPVFTQHANQLGARYNNIRCIACHTLNGRSAPPVLGNVLDTMTVLTAANSSTSLLTADPTYGLNVQQHATSTNASDYSVSVQSYQTSLHTLPDGETVELQKPVYAFKGPVPAQYSVRQAPQIIGMGLLEAVDESTILALADPNDRDNDGVRGVPNWATDPETGQRHLGRFGWKASKATLRQQAGVALIQDIGVTSPVAKSPACQRGTPNCNASGSATSVSENEIQKLSFYLSLLGVPAQHSLRSGFPDGVRVSPEHDVNPTLIQRGSALFAQVKCVACHTPQMQTGKSHIFAELRNQTIHPYSDLLLHNMGAGLADTLTEGQATPAMWRTAPLWGIGSLKYVQGGEQNVRYLHDGRARTLMEAVSWHGGEADTSRTLFEGLSQTDRAAILAFLGSL